MSRGQELLAKLALLALPLMVILGLLAWQLDRYTANLRFYDEAHERDYMERDFSPLAPADLIQLGTAHSPNDRPSSSYTQFDQSKPAGVVRIGIFGCSFTQGAETIDGADFPSLLQREIDLRVDQPVEVINFGVGGYGLQQSYLLWQTIGRKYDLDHTVFNLFRFHPDRDATFVHLYNEFGPVHARYILQDGDLNLVKVVGANRLEASKIYYRMVPPWRYLHYDSKPPPLLRALVPNNRYLRLNPLYYSRDTEELAKIYDLIFTDLAEKTNNLIVLSNDEIVYSWRKRVPAAARSFVRMESTQRTWSSAALFRAPMGHLSALGNLAFARELFSILTGERPGPTPLWVVDPSAAPLDPEPPTALQPLNTYHNVYLGIADQPLVVFTSQLAGRPTSQTMPYWFSSHGTQSLLDLSGPARSRFLPLDRLLEDGASISIQMQVGGETQSIRVATLRAPSGVFGRVSTSEARNSAAGEPLRVQLSITDQGPVVKVHTTRPATDVFLRVSDNRVLNGEVRPQPTDKPDIQVFDLKPIEGPFLSLRAHREQSPDALADRPTGTIDLVLIDQDRRTHSVPVLIYRTIFKDSPAAGESRLSPILTPRRAPRTVRPKRSP